MPAKGNLYLIPTVIADETHDKVIPLQVRQELASIRHFLVENVRSARRFLSSLKIYESIESLEFGVLDKSTAEQDLPSLFTPVYDGKNLGILSEAGCPGIADPGALAVKYAHQQDIKVVPLVGPSSILLALMASGLNGQRFAFQGYLPVKPNEVAKAIRDFEMESKTKGMTQVFIETPYRNKALMQHLLKILHPDTRLCVAVDLTGATESIHTFPVSEWRRKPVELPKLPALFLFLANT